MSEYIVPLSRVMVLQHALERGGVTTCPVRRPEISIDAHIQIENDNRSHLVTVTLGPIAGSITLLRGDSLKYTILRDFIQDLANGRTDTGAQSEQAVAMREALESVNAVLDQTQVAYITPTSDAQRPFRVIVLDQLGDICARTKGHCKDHLAEVIRQQLRPVEEKAGELP